MKCGKNLDPLLFLYFFVEGSFSFPLSPRQLIYGRGLSQPFSLPQGSFIWFDMKYNQHFKIFPWLLTQWYPHAGGCFLFPHLLSLGYLLPGLLLDGELLLQSLDKASLASLTLHTVMLLFPSSLASCTWLVDLLFDFPSSFYDSGNIVLTIREKGNTPG